MTESIPSSCGSSSLDPCVSRVGRRLVLALAACQRRDDDVGACGAGSAVRDQIRVATGVLHHAVVGVEVSVAVGCDHLQNPIMGRVSFIVAMEANRSDVSVCVCRMRPKFSSGSVPGQGIAYQKMAYLSIL